MVVGTYYLPKRISADVNSSRASLKVSSSSESGICDGRHVNRECNIRMRGSFRLQGRLEKWSPEKKKARTKFLSDECATGETHGVQVVTGRYKESQSDG